MPHREQASTGLRANFRVSLSNRLFILSSIAMPENKSPDAFVPDPPEGEDVNEADVTVTRQWLEFYAELIAFRRAGPGIDGRPG